MRKLVFYVSLVFLWTSVYAIEVDRKELQEAENTPIEFINYSGTHRVIDSLQSIERIGESLAGAVKTGRAGDVSRYAVIHAVDTTVSTGFDADILIIGKNARVDHINNLRVIIAGYLRRAYGYSEKDSKTIAHFVTIYNAVYRGNMQAFQERYKPVVIKHLSQETAGLAVRYDAWPGKTALVIPLSDAKYQGTLSAIDTGSISDKNVVEKMREQDDRDIATRKDMIELKERESEDARERAAAAQQEADSAHKIALEKQQEAAAAQKDASAAQKNAGQSDKAAAQAEKEAAAAKKQAETSKAAAQKAQQDAQRNPDDKTAADSAAQNKKQAVQDAKRADEKADEAAVKRSDAEKAEKMAQDKQDAADKKQQEADEAARQAAEKQKAADSEKRFADEKEKEVQRDRKDVAVDTREILEEEAAERKAADDALFAAAFPGAMLRVVNTEDMLSELVMIDIQTGKQMTASPLKTIRGRTLLEGSGKLVAVAGIDSGNEMITLVALDPETLEVTQQASVPLAAQTVLTKGKEGYYAVVNKDGKYFVGRFNEAFSLEAASKIEVLPYTAIRVTLHGVLAQNPDNSIVMLNPADLSQIFQ